MSRKRSGSESLIDKIESGVAVDERSEPEVQVRPEVTLREIVMPMGEKPDNGFIFHLNIQLESDIATALAQLADGLDRERATLRNGTRVVSRRQAATWMLEQLSK